MAYFKGNGCPCEDTNVTLHLLIIDDDPNMRSLYTATLGRSKARSGNSELEMLDLTMDVAPSADAAKALLESKRYDLALVDLNLGPNGLGDFTGLSVLAHIRRAALETEAIIMSSQDDEPTVRACLDAGADGFVSKNGEFVARLRREVRHARRSDRPKRRSAAPRSADFSAYAQA